MASFSVVALTKEEPEHLRRFARYYVAAGAARVLVHHDGAAQPGLLGGVRGAELIACDDAFWERLGVPRPEAVEDRQRAVYARAVPRLDAEWALIVDADEFVFGEASIGGFLDALPPGVSSVQVPTAEAVFGPRDDLHAEYGASVFRLPVRDEAQAGALARSLYGPLASYFVHGLLGHAEGKQFLRAGRPYDGIDLHLTWHAGGVITVLASELVGVPSMRLGHYDALSLPRWQEKWRRRVEGETRATAMSAPRRRQMALVAEALAQGGDAPKRLFRALYALTDDQAASLRAWGALCERALDVPPG